MFQSNEAVNIKIIVNNKQILVPGITTCNEYTADRTSRTTGSLVPAQFVDVISYHAVPAEYSRSGVANTFYKHQRQPSAFMDYRTEAIAELDELTADELFAKVAESLDHVQHSTTHVQATVAEHTVKPKASFGTNPVRVLVHA